MATLLQDLVTLLIAKDVVTADGVDVFRDILPADPNEVLSLIEYNTTIMGKGVGAGKRYIRVAARSTHAETARAKALKAFLALESMESVTYLTPTRWAVLYTKQSPFRVGTDESGRVLYGFNIAIIATFE